MRFGFHPAILRPSSGERELDRMAETKVPFHPVKCGFGRMAEPSRSFRPVKCGFGRMGTQLEVFARRKHTTNH